MQVLSMVKLLHKPLELFSVPLINPLIPTLKLKETSFRLEQSSYKLTPSKFTPMLRGIHCTNN